jgi:putative alpha-1,2-mannosidase
MLGFYPVCPGSGEYVITTPAFEEIKIQLPDGKYFTSRSSGLTEDNFYINSATKNGKKFKGNIITHKEIMDGCELIFEIAK